jgi:FKBP-type peptidyl-prolyl cis-trans isomerase
MIPLKIINFNHMNKFLNTTFVLSIVAISFLNFGCNKNSRDFEQEMTELKDFILEQEAKGIDIDTARTGIFYILKNEEEGPTPQQGDTCYIEYQCYLLNNKLIESSEDLYPPNGIWKFVYAPNDMIMGLRAGLSLMNTSCEMDIIIPSNMAYGKEGTANIPPYSTLIYVVKMHDLKVKNN